MNTYAILIGAGATLVIDALALVWKWLRGIALPDYSRGRGLSPPY